MKNEQHMNAEKEQMLSVLYDNKLYTFRIKTETITYM